MTHSHPTRLAAVALSLGLLLAACGSDSTAKDSTGSDAPSSNPAPDDSTSTDPAPAPLAEGDVCAMVPTLEEITAQLGEAVTGVRRLERGPGTDLCEAAGEGAGNVQFSRVTESSIDQVIVAATELGYPPVDVNDPALPGAITYAGLVSVFVGDVEYSVQAIAMDTVGDPNSALAVQRSAALLATWLQNMGVAL